LDVCGHDLVFSEHKTVRRMKKCFVVDLLEFFKKGLLYLEPRQNAEDFFGNFSKNSFFKSSNSRER
jgi:hypothetical protein